MNFYSSQQKMEMELQNGSIPVSPWTKRRTSPIEETCICLIYTILDSSLQESLTTIEEMYVWALSNI